MCEREMVELMMKIHFCGGFLLASVIFLILLAGYRSVKRVGKKMTRELERLIREVENDAAGS